ncbi:transcription initiation factor TFIID subunit 5-like [Drosophila guanche]|uniref:Blast:Transcription initiation factor TFIID subunit 5 n=1 Tax=Drosophila guanche TaxID=7266 RepID=A0A3B0K8Z3_DROGU|nr:transcription initiation factor TFIID subunit 5-like [Drosophila guanche]SPP79998.1 blast:Transcription initiation factor TFIID subunit 5 [Drosophila guanche]
MAANNKGKESTKAPSANEGRSLTSVELYAALTFKGTKAPKTDVPLVSTFVVASEYFVDGVVLCVSISADTSLLAVGKPDCLIYIYGLKLNVAEGNADWTSEGNFNLFGHQVQVTRGAFSPNRKHLVTWSPDLDLRLWNLESRSCVGFFPNSQRHVKRIVFDPFSILFVTMGEQGVFSWAKTGTEPDIKLRRKYQKYYVPALSVCAYHPKITSLATGFVNAKVCMSNMTAGVPSQVRSFAGHTNSITALAFSTCAEYLVAGAEDGCLIVWHVMTQMIIRRLNHHTRRITSIAFAPDNGSFAAGSKDTYMSVWDFDLLVLTKKDKNLITDVLLKGSQASECGTTIYEVRFVTNKHLMAICVDKPEEIEEDGESAELVEESL